MWFNNGSLRWKKLIFTSTNVKEIKLPTVRTIHSTHCIKKHTIVISDDLMTVTVGNLFYSIQSSLFTMLRLILMLQKTLFQQQKQNKTKIQNHCNDKNDINGLTINKQIKYLENAIVISMVCKLNINNIINIHSTCIFKTIVSRKNKHHLPNSMLLTSIRRNIDYVLVPTKIKMKMRMVLVADEQYVDNNMSEA